MDYDTATHAELTVEFKRLSIIVRDASRERFLITQAINLRGKETQAEKKVSKMSEIERDAYRTALAQYP